MKTTFLYSILFSFVLFVSTTAFATEDCAPYRSAYDVAVAKVESVKNALASVSAIAPRYAAAKAEENAAYFALSSCELRNEKESLTNNLATYTAKRAAMESAYNRFVARDYEGAGISYEKIMNEVEPSSAEYTQAKTGVVRSRIMSSTVFALKEDWGSARARAVSALELDPGNDRALYLVGYCYENEKDYEGALGYYSRSMDATSDAVLIVELRIRIAATRRSKSDADLLSVRKLEAAEIVLAVNRERLKKVVDLYFAKVERQYAKFGSTGSKKKFAKLRDALSRYSFPDADRQFVRDYLLELADRKTR